ncbi:hypothetical protein AMTR_s00131p00023390 [Amborella trichopoda]|uniref:Uncharacterized protein n=1 Tax=Amborella trichopoda TaxID=13333 RepID=W1NR10_AMBTC|nr:hypothetical protein AMTR_s00131p00023390 [Amborella trichopoda]
MKPVIRAITSISLESIHPAGPEKSSFGSAFLRFLLKLGDHTISKKEATDATDTSGSAAMAQWLGNAMECYNQCKNLPKPDSPSISQEKSD